MKLLLFFTILLVKYTISKNLKSLKSLFSRVDLNRGYIIENTYNTKRAYNNENDNNNNLPSEWLWSDIEGTNYLTNVQTQHSPQYCSGAWALSTTSALQDRIKILRKAAWPEIYLASQVLLSCNEENQGCSGGNPLNAYKYIKENNIPDSTCSNYQGKGYDDGLTCTDFVKCGYCRHGECRVVEEYQQYTISEYGSVSGEQDMMAEIYQRGPITCTISNTIGLELYRGGIFWDKTGATEPNHVVSVVGYGVEDGENYWFVRNTVGEYWGEKGYFKIVRGVNNLGIEENCSFGVVEDTWGDKFEKQLEETELRMDEENIDVQYTVNKDGALYDLELNTAKKIKQRRKNIEEFNKKSHRIYEKNIISPLPNEYLSYENLPKHFDWRNVNGVNYLSWVTNQQSPERCGSCWAHATTAMMADRSNVQKKNQFPSVVLSTQAVVNSRRGGGSCKGGNQGLVISNFSREGVPYYTCQVYTSTDTEKQQCQRCFKKTDGGEFCEPVENYINYPKVSAQEFGQLEDASEFELKSEIFQRGPITCYMQVTDLFSKYEGGIYKEQIDSLDGINHVISVVGWGESQEGEKYWVVRNSWGVNWGESGYFKISMDNDYNLNLTSSCFWAVPNLNSGSILSYSAVLLFAIFGMLWL